MVDRVNLTYVNINRGLMYKTSSTQPLKMEGCIGKTVKVEVCEMDTIKVDDKDWYQIIGYVNELALVERIVE